MNPRALLVSLVGATLLLLALFLLPPPSASDKAASENGSSDARDLPQATTPSASHSSDPAASPASLRPARPSLSSQPAFGQRPKNSHDLQKLATLLRRDTDPLQLAEKADGSRFVSLEGTFQTASLARRRADGTFEIVCFENFSQAEKFLLKPPPPVQPPQDEPLQDEPPKVTYTER
ncbi:MAG: hypothetical protein AAF555_08935 [Verrucomicrobiota bacterium]